jgi:hypothetical protein
MVKRSAPIGSVTTNARNRLTNSSGRLLADVDGRGSWVRQFRAALNQHLTERGGVDAISVAEASILRRCATLETELAILELRFAANNGADSDGIDLYQRTANSLRRLFESIGMQRRPKDITPSLASYLASPKPTDVGHE